MWTFKHNRTRMYGMSEKAYQPVPETEDGDYETSNTTDPKQRHGARQTSLSVILGLTIAITFALTVTVGVTANHLLQSNSPTSSNPTWSSCGGTPEEARRRNCHFDLLSFAWQTAECYDHENTEAFRTHNGTWTYYTAYRGNETRSEDEAITGEKATFVTAEYHFTHCTYMWRQMHRAYSLRGFIDNHVGQWNHTLHCQKVLLDGPSMRRSEVNTVGIIRYPVCRRIW